MVCHTTRSIIRNLGACARTGFVYSSCLPMVLILCNPSRQFVISKVFADFNCGRRRADLLLPIHPPPHPPTWALSTVFRHRVNVGISQAFCQFGRSSCATWSLCQRLKGLADEPSRHDEGFMTRLNVCAHRIYIGISEALCCAIMPSFSWSARHASSTTSPLFQRIKGFGDELRRHADLTEHLLFWIMAAPYVSELRPS
ncbi:hypothetical protein BV25DRAFT_709035 [Artomyces pyxidatus]|uniref:Uncharacterized protein n=1 Tax=Artomyces pyxidatus TaxID=48021 RepID=A0ACB8T075_9AGAM|nr:hypothetical protein BV25DRAFT_709035 [Artomyces pyxidatus]